MDLVFRRGERFYLVDWKSNWLGDRFEDYEPAPIRKAMEAHRYFLQYHLYLVALDLYLARRVPDYDYEKHFGGVFYIFLRGIDPEHPARGIFHDRPPQTLVHALRERLAGS
jgi:exodeoxyribonuclease V beta subunit